MQAINHFDQNRPVHLVLRDIHYERAIALFTSPELLAKPELTIADYETILFMLRTARKHGQIAVRDNGKNVKDGQFCEFINMLAGNVKAILSMLNLKHSVEAEDGFFFSFLEVNHASVALQAEEYERRARDIIRCLLKTLELAGGVFEKLKQENLNAFSDFERERYDTARAHHEGLIGSPDDLPKYIKRTGLFV